VSPDKPPECCRTDVQVEVDGEHYPGRLRSCDELPDGTWSCLVTVQVEPGAVRTSRFDAHQLR
jgi:hypothetical protein